MISKSEFLNRVHGSVFVYLKRLEQKRQHAIKKWLIGMLILAVILTTIACYTIYHYIGYEMMLIVKNWVIVPVMTFTFPLIIGWVQLPHLNEECISLLYDLVGLKEEITFQKPYDCEEIEKKLQYKGLIPCSRSLLGSKFLLDPKFISSKDNSFVYTTAHSNVKSVLDTFCLNEINFDGILFEMNTKTNLNKKILIVQKLSFWSTARFRISKKTEYKKISTGDICFDNYFQVYAENETEAKIMLNKMFLKKIMSLRDIYPKTIINLLIENGKITITFNTDKNMFEFFSIYRSFLNDKLFEKFYDEVANLYKVRDIFKS